VPALSADKKGDAVTYLDDEAADRAVRERVMRERSALGIQAAPVPPSVEQARPHILLLMQTPRPDRLRVFKERIRREVHGADYWRVLRFLYLESDQAPHLQEWVELFRAAEPERHQFHVGLEQQSIDTLPSEFEAFRGCNGWSTAFGMSWTTQMPIAIRYARRACVHLIDRHPSGPPPDAAPMVLRAKIKKEAVLAGILEFGNAEVIIDPSKIVATHFAFVDPNGFEPWPSLQLRPGRTYDNVLREQPPGRKAA
jgi:hypothetical protein